MDVGEKAPETKEQEKHLNVGEKAPETKANVSQKKEEVLPKFIYAIKNIPQK